MFENSKNGLKDVAKAFLGIGIAFFGLLGFILIVALESTYKLIGLACWFFGPALTLFCSIVIYGVGLKQEELKLQVKNTNLMEINAKRLDKIILILKDDESKASIEARKEAIKKARQEVEEIKSNMSNSKSSYSNNNYSNNNYSNSNNNYSYSTKPEEKKSLFSLDDDVKVDTSIFNTSNDTKVEEKETVDVETYLDKIDYKTNINNCVLFDSSLTLPYGDTIQLEYSYGCDLNETSVIFIIEGKTYCIEMNNEVDAKELFEKLETKQF